MSIEEMEKAYKTFNDSKVNTLGHRWGIEDFMEHCINLHKDHIEKIAKLENMLRELIKSDDKQLINNEGDYVYEPNE
jgi:hypothetical protein